MGTFPQHEHLIMCVEIGIFSAFSISYIFCGIFLFLLPQNTVPVPG